MLNIKKDEKGIVTLLVLHSFLIGLSISFLISSTNSLFLSTYSASLLPYIYTVVAIALPIIGLIYNKIQSKIDISKSFISIIIFIFSLIVLLHSLIIFHDVKWVYFALMIVLEVALVYFELEFWGVVGVVFDIRQSKRLLGIVGSGQELAIVIGGFSTPFIVNAIGTKNLLFIVEASILLTLIVLSIILKKYSTKFTNVQDEEELEIDSFKNDFKDRYILLIFAVTVLASFVYYFVDYIFYEEITIKYPTEDELSGFIGIFFAVAGIINFIFTSMVSGWFLNRFGLLIGLLALPIFISFGASAMVIAWILVGSLIFLIPIAIITKLFYVSVDTSIDKPSFKLLYQVFSSKKRVSIQAKTESFIDPIAGGVIGLLLIFLTSTLEFSVVGLSVILILMTLIWVFLAIILKKEYTSYLLKALSKKKLDVNLEIDSQSLEIVKRGLNSKYPAEVLYSLEILERFDKNIFLTSLQELLKKFSNQNRDIQLFILEKIEEYKLDFKKEIEELINLEKNLEIRAKLIKSFAIIAEDEAIEKLSQFLNSSEFILQKYAIIGLIKAGGISGILLAGEKFNALVNSTNPKDRVIACEILGEIKVSNFYQPLIKLLEDKDLSVRKSAIIASAKLKSPKLWKYIINNLSDIKLAQTSSLALISAGDEILNELEAEFYRDAVSEDVLIKIIKICGKLKSKKAINFLMKNINYKNENIYFEVINSLVHIEAILSDYDINFIKTKIRDEVAHSTYIMQSIIDLKESEYLTNSLSYQLIKNRNRIFNLLSLLYDKSAMAKVKLNLEQKNKTKEAYAFELLDNILSKELKSDIFILLEDIDLTKKLNLLKSKFPQKSLNINERLVDISKHDIFISSWVKTTLIYTMGLSKDKIFTNYIKESLNSNNLLVQECAIWAIAQIDKKYKRKIKKVKYRTNSVQDILKHFSKGK